MHPRRVLLFYFFSKKGRLKMKKLFISLISVLLTVVFVLCFCACRADVNADELWENAVYLEDTELGAGEKAVTVEVKAGEKSVIFTIHTDASVLGDALLEHSLIDGEIGAYGMYIKKVNGITADYDVDQSYWGFYKDGEYMITGVDATEFSNGDSFELVYTK